MEYWNSIDLHQHTNHDIDCKGRHLRNNYSHTYYFEWLKLQQVKLKAVTCHNNIDLAEHVKHAIVSDLLGINHLVGVEIDYKFETKEFQAITVLSPNVDIIKFSDKLNKIRNPKNNNVFFSKDDFCELHQDTEFIFIPHAIKDKGILQQRIGDLEKSTIDWVIKSIISGLSYPVLFENTKDFHLYSMIEKINKTLNMDNVEVELPAYIGSDYKFDDDAERKKAILARGKYSINSLPTYRGLEIALRNSSTRLSLENQIINRERFITSIKITENSEISSSFIEFSPGLNVIIGNSGSGKTLLLNQIYFELKNKGLKAAKQSNKDKDNKNPYESKVGKNKILNIKLDKEIPYSDLKIIEIPNIYSEILKSQDSPDSLTEMFGINNSNKSNEIILQFKQDVDTYYQNVRQSDEMLESGITNYNNIKSAIDFLNNNKLEKINFSITKSIYNETEITKNDLKLEQLKKVINNKSNIIKYFNDIKELVVLPDTKKHIDNLLLNYEILIKDLNLEHIKLIKQQKKLLFEKKLYGNINENIEKSISMLGNKEKTNKAREEIFNKELQSMISNIKSLIGNEKILTNIQLEIPYEKIKKEIEKNHNSYARLTLDDAKFNMNNVDILDSYFFNIDNKKTKIKSIGEKKVNLLDSESIKSLIRHLNQIDINLSDIINEADNLPKNIELYMNDNEKWKLVENINKGDIAKKSIEFHFNKIVKDEQPDIILIDQPENDVDKSFISETLSQFIREQKIEKQIIVTSHDAIVAINSDANKIIESSIDKNNKMHYESYPLEYVEEEKLVATNKVALILDGGKQNIKKRYQIYGGDLNYENNNL